MFIEAMDDVSGGDNWNYKSCKAPVKSSSPTSQHPVFYRPDALPVAQPTVSKHWREKYNIPWTCLPKLTWGLSALSLTTNSSWLPWGIVSEMTYTVSSGTLNSTIPYNYLGGGLPCLSSTLWCQYPNGDKLRLLKQKPKNTSSHC